MAEHDQTLDATQLADGLDATEIGGSSTGGARESMLDSVSTVALGQTLAGHQLERRLGAGGMGEVYAATRLADGQPVALKVLGRASATNLYRFKREFRALADVRHPNLVGLHELVVPTRGLVFFTMELVDGQLFTDYVRGPSPAGELPNLERLLRVFRQLIEGVQQLHQLGCVHRDLKPSNVLVDRGGRVVILDFGLVSEAAEEVEGVTHDGQLLGTPAYMAPEQGISGRAGPAADYYALGVMLYECLCGERPFTGSAMRIMIAKQDGEIPDPGVRTAGVLPRELRDACMRLLHPDPSLRPTGRELLALLGEAEGSEVRSSTSTSQKRKGAFVGRSSELAQMRAALRDVVETQTAVTMLVHGPSGTGKSALVHHFATKMRQRADQSLVLAGRCLERESVPYKGFDAIVDALSVHLRRLPAVEAATFQPRHAAAMIKLFPVFGDVWQRVGTGGSELDATAQRRLGLGALRELLMRLSDLRPLVVCIDDFQWADLDSVMLLAALARPPRAPALLLVIGYDDEHEQSPALLELRDPATFAGRDLRDLALGPLTHNEAVALALALLPDPPDPSRAEALARRAKGNPFWLQQLAFGDADDARSGAEDLALDELVLGRLAALEPESRQIIDLVTLAGGPLGLDIAGQVLGLERETLDGRLRTLVERGLLVRARVGRGAYGLGLASESGSESGASVDLAHPRSRKTLLGHIEASSEAELQLALARALERSGADAETLARHLAAAGELAEAADYAERSALEAADALAFGRAAEALRETLGYLEGLGDAAERGRVTRLREVLAEQLVYLGQSGAAGDLMLQIAAEVSPEHSAELRRQAVVQLARCGRLDEAIAILGALLDELGERMPRSQWRAFLMFGIERLRLALRGEHFEAHDASEVDAKLLARVDTLMAGAVGFSIHEVGLTMALGSRGLRLAFDTGDPERLALGLSYRYISMAAMGKFRLADELGAHARQIAALADEPEVYRAVDLSDAMVEWFRRDNAKSKQLFIRLLNRAERGPMPDWIRSTAVLRFAELCRLSGAFAEFRAHYPRWIAVARERGNLHEFATLEAVAANVDLHYGDFDEAQAHLDAAHERWQPSRYTFANTSIEVGVCDLLLARGQVDEARTYFEGYVERLRDSGLIHFRTISEIAEALGLRVVTAQLAAAPARVELQREVRRAARPRRRRREPRRVGEALLSQAALASLRGDQDRAIDQWRRALRHCERYDLCAHAAAIRLRLAERTRGHEAADHESAGSMYLDEQGLGDRELFVRLLAPG